MGLRLILSRLASGHTRASAARALAALCITGYVLTLLFSFATSGTLQRWFFLLLVWGLFIYVPVRILLEAAQTLAPNLRRQLSDRAARDPGRYASRSSAELMVEGLFEQHVVLPRIATPAQGIQAREGALAVLMRADRFEEGLRGAVDDCLGSLQRWVADVGVRAREGGVSIQGRWAEVRAIAALAAMTRVLAAADEDRSGHSRPDAPAFLDACLDYCDDLALHVDAPVWEEPALTLVLPEPRAESMCDAWQAFCATPPPALAAKEAFVDILLNARGSLPPTPPTVS